MEHLFIINPKSFSPNLRKMDHFISRIKKFFREKEEQCTIHISRFPRDAIIIIRRYFKNAATDTRIRVYSVGGDGEAFDCLNGIIGMPNAELAVMPYGTGSDFVRAFGLRHYNDFRDVRKQAAASTIPVDVIKCNENYALNFCAVGAEASANIKIISLTSRFEHSRRRFPFFDKMLNNIGSLGAPFDKRVMGQSYEIYADGEDISGEYHGINIANGPYYGYGMSAVTSAVPDDGLLDMILIKKISFFKSLIITGAYTHGGWKMFPNSFIFRRVKKVSIHSSKPIFVDLDGEAFFDTRLDIEIIPKPVNVVSVSGGGFERIDTSFGDSKGSAVTCMFQKIPNILT
jgi:diacylglycerol kinase family enzyme